MQKVVNTRSRLIFFHIFYNMVNIYRKQKKMLLHRVDHIPLSYTRTNYCLSSSMMIFKLHQQKKGVSIKVIWKVKLCSSIYRKEIEYRRRCKYSCIDWGKLGQHFKAKFLHMVIFNEVAVLNNLYKQKDKSSRKHD